MRTYVPDGSVAGVQVLWEDSILHFPGVPLRAGGWQPWPKPSHPSVRIRAFAVPLVTDFTRDSHSNQPG